ncbi:VWA domain-containing protein [Shewanella sp. SR44-3]|uniref:VWA domain-containing protein n=2 Tax=unclassified Shewanella TaxID=196818 RepID=UPI0015F80CF2|nr:VWA domain-containing protein [Shewanella sp. SR44-3]MBB1269560.1 VWA domain-containing protein [Shewanella sp. SR44-3]
MPVHFIRPEWLLLLLPLALLSLLTWRKKNQQSAWQHYIAPHLTAALISPSIQSSKHPTWVLAGAWFIAVIAAAGPAINKQQLPVFATEQGRVLIMDMSLSMLATDMSPNRLSQAKFRASDLISQLKEGETGLIAYAGDAFTISPLTRDNATLLNLLPSLSPDIMPARGSDLSSALRLAQSLLAQGGHINGDIIVLTDGISSKQFDNAKASLKNSRYRLSILALGSEQGAPIRLADGQLLKDNVDEVIIAKTNYGLLQKLARYQQGIVVPAQADGSDLKQLQDWLATDGDARATELEGETWQDLGPYLALLLLLPCLLSFRRGLLPLMALFMFYQPSTAQASLWDDLWKTRDQQAIQAYQGEDYQVASSKFEDPQWRASAQYKAGEYQAALEGFEQDTSAEGLFNQGNALMQLGKLNKAIKRYQEALTLNADFPAARRNLAIAQQAKQDKTQQGDNQSTEEDGASEDGEQEQGSDDNNGANTEDNGANDQGSDSENSDGAKSGSKESQDGDSDSQDTAPKQDDAQQDSEQQSPEPQKNQSGQDDGNNPDGLADEQQSKDNDTTKPEKSQGHNADDDQAINESQNSQSGQTEPQENEASMQAQVDKSETPVTPSAGPGAEASDLEPKKPVQSGQMLAPTQAQTEALPADMERALRAVSEDPQVLLRNKMQLEYLKRRQEAQAPKDDEQW